MRVDLFADVVCPWCFIGSERLQKVFESVSPETTVVHHPFLLQPGTPEAGMNIHEYLRSKYGGDPKAIFARAEAAARDTGIPLDLSKQPMSYPTVKAHTLLRHAEKKGTQRAFIRALYRTHFLEAQNISDPQVLTCLAVSVGGFQSDEVSALLADHGELEKTRTESEQGLRLGIQGVPFFVFNEKIAVSGAQSEEVLRKAIAEASKLSVP